MLTVIASLTFAAAAIFAIGGVVATWTRYRDVALANIAALGAVPELREFRFVHAGVVQRPAARPQSAAQRLPIRNSARPRVRASQPLRAAA